MDQLIIKLKGEIESSNFYDWKKDLSTQIQSANIDLATENDYAIAEMHVKSLKSAERLLKEAKRSAIDQAADIQRLFDAIDEISEEARQARLSLERQIKRRKQEIKEEMIQSGITSVRTYLDQQNDYFQLIDHSKYLDKSRFESVVKGKASVKGIQSAIDRLCFMVRGEVCNKAVDVTNKGRMLDSLDSKYQPLFQDRKSLLELTEQAFGELLDERISLFNSENTIQIVNVSESSEYIEINTDTVENSQDREGVEEKFRVILDILATKEAAIEITRSIKREYDGKSFISGIRLIPAHDE